MTRLIPSFLSGQDPLLVSGSLALQPEADPKGIMGEGRLVEGRYAPDRGLSQGTRFCG
jgi:hypothetical protein